MLLESAVYSQPPYIPTPSKKSQKLHEIWFAALPGAWKCTCAMWVFGMTNPGVELKCGDHRLYRCFALNFLHWLRLKGQWARFIPARKRKWPKHIIGGVIDRRRWPKKTTWAVVWDVRPAHAWHFKPLGTGGRWHDEIESDHFSAQRLRLCYSW